MIAQTELEIKVCPTCGIAYAAPIILFNEHRSKGAGSNWYCPNGHRLHFTTTTEDALRAEKNELERRMQAQLNEANHARLVAEKEYKKALKDKRKLERRVAHGVCPCCNQTFADLSHHMLTEHKEFRLPEGKDRKALPAATT